MKDVAVGVFYIKAVEQREAKSKLSVWKRENLKGLSKAAFPVIL